MLKKELAEMRANQALSEDKNIQSITSLDREVGRARGLMSSTNAEADMERSAHRETMEALDASENSVSVLKINLTLSKNRFEFCLELIAMGYMQRLMYLTKPEED